MSFKVLLREPKQFLSENRNRIFPKLLSVFSQFSPGWAKGSILILFLHPSLNRPTPVNNNMQMIHSFMLLSAQSLLSKIVLPSVITVWLSTQIKLTRFSLAPTKNSVLWHPQKTLVYLHCHMSMLLAPQYICQKSKKILGAALNQQLSFQDHVNTVYNASFYHLRSFRHLWPALSWDIAKTLGNAVIGARLNYANSILHGILNEPSVFTTSWRELSWAHPHQSPPKTFKVSIGCLFNIAFATKSAL